MVRYRWMTGLVLAGLGFVPVACGQSPMMPASGTDSGDFFHFRKSPTPTRTATPSPTPTPKATQTATPSPTPTAMVPTPSPTAAVPSPTSTSVVPSPTVVATCNPETALGNEFAGSSTFLAGQQAIYAQPETASVSGNLAEVFLNVHVPPFAMNGMIGVYSDNAGQPGSLLAHSALFTSLTTGPNVFPVPPVAVTQGTRYWLVLYISSPNGGNLTLGEAPAPGPLVQYSTLRLNTLPLSLSGLTITGEFNAALNMEADICK